MCQCYFYYGRVITDDFFFGTCLIDTLESAYIETHEISGCDVFDIPVF